MTVSVLGGGFRARGSVPVASFPLYTLWSQFFGEWVFVILSLEERMNLHISEAHC